MKPVIIIAIAFVLLIPVGMAHADYEYENWYHRKCVWHIAHLVRLDNFF